VLGQRFAINVQQLQFVPVMPDFAIENELRTDGYYPIAGIDEAGRGPLAGPVVAAAAILPEGFVADGLNDSKKLSPSRREKLHALMTSEHSGVVWSLARVDPKVIDDINILKATHRAMSLAAESLSVKPAMSLIDGLPITGFPYSFRAIVKGDSQSMSIAAASVLAKVERDRIMMEYAKRYPEYGFDRHKGYGTRLHLEALRSHGPCEIHRRSFAPVAQCFT
jgi:ribonuclease HII